MVYQNSDGSEVRRTIQIKLIRLCICITFGSKGRFWKPRLKVITMQSRIPTFVHDQCHKYTRWNFDQPHVQPWLFKQDFLRSSNNFLLAQVQNGPLRDGVSPSAQIFIMLHSAKTFLVITSLSKSSQKRHSIFYGGSC